MPQVYVFWTEYKRSEVQDWKRKELASGRLRQGWGGPGAQLVENGRRVPYEEWQRRFTSWVNRWKVPAYERQAIVAKAHTRYEILGRMLDMEQGDLLVVPHLPTDDKISLVQVAGGYRWDPSQSAPVSHDLPDFGHVVEIDPSHIVTLGREDSAETRALAEKFHGYRSAVMRVGNRSYAENVWRLFRTNEPHG